MTVRIAAQFTKDTRVHNGLITHANTIAKNRHDWTGYALVQLECVRVTDEVTDGLEIPTVGITRIELVPDTDVDDIRNRLAALYETRTGATPIPGIDGQQPDADLDDGPVAARKPDEWLEP